MHIARLITTGLVTGVAAAMTLEAPAYAATPKATVVYSSSTFLPSHFSVHHGTIAVLACTTVTQVRADKTAGALPYPGCGSRVEGSGGIAYSRDGATITKTTTVHTMTPTQEVTSNVTLNGDIESRISVSDYEYAANPDGHTRYGTTSKNRCVLKGLGADAAYSGRLDTALPSVAAGPNSSW